MDWQESGFVPFGSAHLAMLACVVLACVVVAFAARLPWVVSRRALISPVLAAVIVLHELAGVVLGFRMGALGGGVFLPLHLCDVSVLALLIALVGRRQWAFEVAYFFGIAGATLAMLTPDMSHGFPSFMFFRFFVTHAAILMGVVFLMSAWSMRPRAGAIRRMVVAGTAYMTGASLANFLLGTNYGFLAWKPAQPTPIDWMGPWPWYVGVLWGVGFCLVLVMYLPWWWFGRREALNSDNRAG